MTRQDELARLRAEVAVLREALETLVMWGKDFATAAEWEQAGVALRAVPLAKLATTARHYCASPTCPGRTYRASDMAHPFNCGVTP